MNDELNIEEKLQEILIKRGSLDKSQLMDYIIDEIWFDEDIYSTTLNKLISNNIIKYHEGYYSLITNDVKNNKIKNDKYILTPKSKILVIKGNIHRLSDNIVIDFESIIQKLRETELWERSTIFGNITARVDEELIVTYNINLTSVNLRLSNNDFFVETLIMPHDNIRFTHQYKTGFNMDIIMFGPAWILIDIVKNIINAKNEKVMFTIISSDIIDVN